MKPEQQTDLFGNVHIQPGRSIVRRNTSGHALAEQGAQRAADHAESVVDGWKRAAYAHLCAYAKTHKSFMTENVRATAPSTLARPPDERAWGYIVQKAVKAKLITRGGYAAQQSANCHCSPKSVWLSLVFAPSA